MSNYESRLNDGILFIPKKMSWGMTIVQQREVHMGEAAGGKLLAINKFKVFLTHQEWISIMSCTN